MCLPPRFSCTGRPVPINPRPDNMPALMESRHSPDRVRSMIDEGPTNTEIAPRIRGALDEVERRIAAAARAVGRPPSDVTLIGVSKVQPEARVQAALDAGLRVFGENRVQEAAGRWQTLRPLYPDLELHLIGPLQTNTVRQAVALFD